MPITDHERQEAEKAIKRMEDWLTTPLRPYRANFTCKICNMERQYIKIPENQTCFYCQSKRSISHYLKQDGDQGAVIGHLSASVPTGNVPE